MKNLKSLTFTAASKQSNTDPVAKKRNKLIARLLEQKLLIDNPSYIATEQRWQKTETGDPVLVDVKRRVRRWWYQDAAGSVFLVVRYGQKVIEFEKGLNAIAVGSKDKLGEVIDVLIAAVTNSELDDVLRSMGFGRSISKQHK